MSSIAFKTLSRSSCPPLYTCPEPPDSVLSRWPRQPFVSRSCACENRITLWVWLNRAVWSTFGAEVESVIKVIRIVLTTHRGNYRHTTGEAHPPYQSSLPQVYNRHGHARKVTAIA